MSRRRRPGVAVARPRDRLRGLIEMRAWEAAVDEARRVVVSEPDSARAYAYMAQALVELKRYDEGLKVAETAIGLDPMQEWHHRLRGLALRGLERYEEALACLEEAVQLEPEATRALHELANCQARCCQWDEMLWTAQRYERLAPDLEAPFHLQANALWGMGDIAGASVAYTEALRLSLEDCPQLHAHVGRLRLWEGRTLDAIECNLQALRMNPRLQFFEASLLYAVRRHLDATGAPPWHEESRAEAPPSWESALSTQLHVLAMRVPGIFVLLSNREAPKLTYESQLSEVEREEARLALAEWRSEISDGQVPLLTDLGLPNDLARSLVEGKTAHCPEGITLDTMLRHWMMTVLDLERGYARVIGDFRHDLLVRDLIEWVASTPTSGLGARIREVLAPWDIRFREATIEVPAADVPGQLGAKWWWRHSSRLQVGA